MPCQVAPLGKMITDSSDREGIPPQLAGASCFYWQRHLGERRGSNYSAPSGCVRVPLQLSGSHSFPISVLTLCEKTLRMWEFILYGNTENHRIRLAIWFSHILALWLQEIMISFRAVHSSFQIFYVDLELGLEGHGDIILFPYALELTQRQPVHHNILLIVTTMFTGSTYFLRLTQPFGFIWQVLDYREINVII